MRLALAPLIAVVVGAATHHEPPTLLPDGWRVVGRSPPSQKIEVTFAVKQENLGLLHDRLMAVSTPGSPDYGHHMSNEAVNKLVAPLASRVETVKAFIGSTAGGATAVAATPNADFLTAVLSIDKAEALLGAEYEELEHSSSGIRIHRCSRTSYRLPPAVSGAVDFVVPTVHIPAVKFRSTTVSATSGSDNNVPSSLRQLYSIGDKTVGLAANNKMAVTAFLGEHFDEKALSQYYDKYCDGLTCGKGFPKLVGDATTGTPGVESMLDIESITGVAGNVTAEFWGFGGRSPDNPANEPFMKWLTTLSSTSDADVPKIFSTSYGEDESSWSFTAAQRLNAEFMKAGARGISLLYASGDEGKQGKYVPEGPGSSPYVTAVGGAQPSSGYPKPGSESGVGLSSGGFSSYWSMPSWQATAVGTYLTTTKDLPPSKVGYNTSGRAYPDISAEAVNFCVTPFGCGVAGTSCATPTASGVFALLNDLRLQAGKPTLGFLNPFIYQNAAAFNDVTTGSSSGGCGGYFGKGWPTAKGWDAVTGVGTPNYEKLAQAVKALP